MRLALGYYKPSICVYHLKNVYPYFIVGISKSVLFSNSQGLKAQVDLTLLYFICFLVISLMSE